MSLKLNNKKIEDICEIKGLEKLSELQILELSGNKIHKIQGLKHLTNLKYLDLSRNNISKIEGLETLIRLQDLILTNNKIMEIEGLESLVNLRLLSLVNNQISEIKGLERLIELRTLYLARNNITELRNIENLELLRTLNIDLNPVAKWAFEIFGYNIESLSNIKIVRQFCEYIKDKDFKDYVNIAYTRNLLKRLEQEKIDAIKRNEQEKTINEAKSYINKLPAIYKEITFKEILQSISLKKDELKNIIEDLIYNGEINGQIKGELIIFNEKTQALSKQIQEEIKPSQEFKTLRELEGKDLEVLRGGDWKIEGNQSIFYFKVKVKNISKFVITTIQIIILSIPKGLEIQTDRYKIDILNPKAYVSPSFKLKATESCVGADIRSIVIYTDAKGIERNIQIEPFEICYVCNLLIPKQITKEEFDQKVDFFEERKIIIDSDYDISELEKKIEKIVRNCNFALLQQIKGSQSKEFKKIEGFAQGLYDKQDVALSVTLRKADIGSKLVLKAMSDKGEKIVDLLKDLSYKMDDIKSDTELIKEYMPQIEQILNKQDDIEIYLREHLATEWEKIKDTWEDYKAGKIDKKELIKQGIKALGKVFVKRILEKVSPI